MQKREISRESLRDEAKEGSNKPVHSVRIGVINAAIWSRDTQYGARYSVTLEQLYKDDDDKWCSTQTISSSNLPVAEKVLSKAFDYVANIEEGR